MPAAIPAVIGGGLSLIGGNRQRDAQQDAIAASQTQLDPGSFTGPGGQGVQFDPLAGTLNTDLGDLEGSRGRLVSLAQQFLGQSVDPNQGQGAFQAGDIFSQLAGQPVPGVGNDILSQLQGQGQVAGNQAFAGLSSAGIGQQGLQDQAFNNAGTQLGSLGQTGQQASASALANFRAQAQPGNERQVNSQLNSLFGTGRLGTTGGANVLGRLQESQNLQDLQFQQAAQGEGRAAQQNALGLAQGQVGIGQGLAQQQDSLLSSAFNRFGQTAGLNADLSGQRFGQDLAGRQFQSGLANQNFQNQFNLSSLGGQLQGQDLQNALAALQGQGGLNTQSLENFGALLNLQNSAANARVGSGTNIAQIASGANFGASPLSSLGGAIIENSSGIGDFLGGLFGGGG